MGADPLRDKTYLTLLQLEKEARDADSDKALSYVMVNRARTLVAHRQAVLFRYDPRTNTRKDVHVQAISDVPTPDRNAPFVRWLKQLGGLIGNGDNGEYLHEIDISSLPQREREELQQWLPPFLLWCPFKKTDGFQIGALLMARDTPWSESDRTLLAHLTGAWGHAWGAILGPRAGRKHRPAWLTKAMLLIVLAIQFIPVSQTALAPAEVVAQKPELVAAPMDGVIKHVHIPTNSVVNKGDLLFTYDDTSLSGQLEVAEEELLVARTALRTARQGAFKDPQRNAEVALLQTRVSLREAERDHIFTRVARKDVHAGRDGVAVFRDASDLEGRPVKTGERIMLIAGPYETELRIDLAVADAIVMEPGSPVRLFLDHSPLKPIDAVLEYISYEAEISASGTLDYRLVARFNEGKPPRIGLRGTAKISGDKVPLFIYLFRRPLSTLRQWLGL